MPCPSNSKCVQLVFKMLHLGKYRIICSILISSNPVVGAHPIAKLFHAINCSRMGIIHKCLLSRIIPNIRHINLYKTFYPWDECNKLSLILFCHTKWCPCYCKLRSLIFPEGGSWTPLDKYFCVLIHMHTNTLSHIPAFY